MAGMILFLGRLEDMFGAEQSMPQFESEITANELILRITGSDQEAYDTLMSKDVRLCINQVMQTDMASIRINSSDEVAFLPPMSGG